MRLLTEEIIENCVPFKWGNPEDMFYVEKIAEAVKKETLKAVGEWLDAHWTVTGGTIREARFANSIIASLLRGEMPEEAK